MTGCDNCMQVTSGDICPVYNIKTPIRIAECEFHIPYPKDTAKGADMETNSRCIVPISIEMVSFTHDPVEVISKAAGTSYGKNDNSKKRVWNCLKAGHMSVFEHASVTFRISGISRACSHQLVRHRMASFCQESQRYTKLDTARAWYIMPEAFGNEEANDGDTSVDLGELYWDTMMQCASAYQRAIKCGVRPEDARYLLPEATKTAVTMTMNCRELFHFFDLRLDKAAQWEIRYLARELKDTLKMYEGWDELVSMYMENRDAPKSAEDEFKKILQKALEDYKKTRGIE